MRPIPVSSENAQRKILRRTGGRIFTLRLNLMLSFEEVDLNDTLKTQGVDLVGDLLVHKSD